MITVKPVPNRFPGGSFNRFPPVPTGSHRFRNQFPNRFPPIEGEPVGTSVEKPSDSGTGRNGENSCSK
jgi:hypothetical protein